MKKREGKYIAKQKTKLLVFENGTLSVPSNNYKLISFLNSFIPNTKIKC